MMYEEWPLIDDELNNPNRCISVLNCYPPNVGLEVAKSVIKSLSSNLSELSENGKTEMEILCLDSVSQVDWTMEVMCFALTLSLNEFETLKDSVRVYISWLSTGLPNSNVNLPTPIRLNSLHYIRKMIGHLENLFVPRNEGPNGNQLALCIQVLTAINGLTKNSTMLDRLTMETIILFILKVSDTVLTPFKPNCLSEQLCEQLMHSFFSILISACVNCFPTPPMWKTISTLFRRWKHHLAVIEWWSKISVVISSKVLMFMQGPDILELKVTEKDLELFPNDFTGEVLIQTWFRILHLIGDPSNFCDKNSMVKYHNKESIDEVFNSDSSTDSSGQSVSLIFLKAMKGISTIADAFLGIKEASRFEVEFADPSSQISGTRSTPQNSRKSGKSKKNQSLAHLSQQNKQHQHSTSSLTSKLSSPPCTPMPVKISLGCGDSLEMKLLPHKNRFKCNSLLNLFGDWLFNAAFAGVRIKSETPDKTSPYINQFKMMSGDQNLLQNPMFEIVNASKAEAGSSEAFGILCRIFCCKKTNEAIDDIYLTRFYTLISKGLQGESKQVISSILLNSVDLLRIDLPGVTLLLPVILHAIEKIIPDRDLVTFKQFTNVTHIRRSCIHLLVSILPLTLQFAKTKQDPNVNAAENDLDFNSMRRRVLDLLTGALQTEVDPINTQLILGALLIGLKDSAVLESSNSKIVNTTTPPGTPLKIETCNGLFVQILLLVTRKLESQPWKYDVTISLAALELISGLAEMEMKNKDMEECLRCANNLCEYITSQCERPRLHHKRELHNVIVSAYHTLGHWLVHHPSLMKNQKCLKNVLEIVELGVSGSKSVEKDTDESIKKCEKQINPISKRVSEAAEELLVQLFEFVGDYPSSYAPLTTCSLLDEKELLRYTILKEEKLTWHDSVCNYRYFGLRSGVLVALLEHNANGKENSPKVTVITRSSQGKKVYTFQLQQVPRHEKTNEESIVQSYPRPSSYIEKIESQKLIKRYFPIQVDSIPLVEADCAIPLLKHVPNNQQRKSIQLLSNLISEQEKHEALAFKNSKPCQMPECNQPEITKSHQSARLLLSHLNFISLNSINPAMKKINEHGPYSVMINEKNTQFSEDLQNFDRIPTRVHNTAFVFYVANDDTTAAQVLSNASKKTVELNPVFREFLLSLGWIINANNMTSWCGMHYKNNENYVPLKLENVDIDKNVGVLNGEKFSLHYANSDCELAFIVPTNRELNENTEELNDEKLILEKDKLKLDFIDGVSIASNPQNESPSSLSENTTIHQTVKKISSIHRPHFSNVVDSRIAVFWCENYDVIGDIKVENYKKFMSTNENYHHNNTSSEIPSIMIHPLESGLFLIRVNQNNTAGKCGYALPLLSGSVVNRRCLGPSVRQLLINISKRQRLISTDYNSPHVRRKQKLLDIINTHQHKCMPADFYTRIFDSDYIHYNESTLKVI